MRGPNKRGNGRASGRRRLRAAVWIAAAVLLADIAGGALAAWWMTRPRRPRETVTAAALGIPYITARFQATDGTPLAGWLIEPAHPTRAPLIILCHGVDSTSEDMLGAAAMLHRRGFSVFAFDFRAHGASGGERVTLGNREPDDLIGAVAYIRSRAELRTVKIGALGESLGAAVAIIAAARCPSIQAVVAESPFARLDHAVDNYFRAGLGPLGPAAAWPARLFGQYLIGCSTSAIAPAAQIGKLAPRPVLLIQDGADQLCPPEETRELLAAGGQTAQLWTVPAATHIEASVAEPAQYQSRVTRFFDRALRRPVPAQIVPKAEVDEP